MRRALLVVLVATLANGAAAADVLPVIAADVRRAPPAPAPTYVLVEEHHHVLPVISARVRNATLVHFDSHHDAGLPRSWAHDDHAPDAALAHVHINNFLLAAALAGAVEHVIFVEPPWSRQCRALHGLTINIRVGFDASGAPRVAYDAPTPAAATALAGFFDPDQETSDELARARNVRFSVVSLADAEAALPRLVGRRAKDVVVDLDLDAYATTSPGALALAHALPAEARLEMYRIAHDVCAFDGDHDFASPTDCAGRPLAPPRGSAPGALDALVAAARDAASVPWTDARAAAFAAVLARHEGAVLDVPRAEEKIAAFVGQPYNDDASAVAAVGRRLSAILAALFRDRAPPAVATAARSPFYLPEALLPAAERDAFRSFEKLWGTSGVLVTPPGVDVDRGGNGRLIPARRDVVPMRHVDERPLWASKVDDLFFSDDDGEHGAAVACRFANDGSEPLRLFWRETEYETLAPGAVADYETSIGSQWSFRALDGAVVRRAVVDVAGTYPASTGVAAFDDAAAIDLAVVAGDVDATLSYDTGRGEGEVPYERLAARETLRVETYHGHVWLARDAAGTLLSRHVVDAGAGAARTFRTGRDELR